jgi:hypothetical protein
LKALAAMQAVLHVVSKVPPMLAVKEGAHGVVVLPAGLGDGFKGQRPRGGGLLFHRAVEAPDLVLGGVDGVARLFCRASAAAAVRSIRYIKNSLKSGYGLAQKYNKYVLFFVQKRNTCVIIRA